MFIATTKKIAVNDKKSQDSIILKRFNWGLTATQNSRQTSLVEVMLFFLGTTFLYLSSALLLPVGIFLVLSDGFHPSDGFLGESLAIFTIAASGIALRYFSIIGVRKQLQVDSQRGEVRLGYLGRDRRFNQNRCIPQSDIRSAFLFRSKGPRMPARLVFRMKTASNPQVVLKGTEAELKPVLNEITDMANRKSKRNIRRRTTGRLEHVRFN